MLFAGPLFTPAMGLGDAVSSFQAGPVLLASRRGQRGHQHMTIALESSHQTAFSQDRLSGTSRSHAIDRWIYVFTAASIIAIVLTGFIPDSLAKIAGIKAGQLPPFPLVLHVHAVLMGSFLLLLLAQTVLVATGKCAWHMQIGIAAMILVPAILVTGLVLVPTIYHNVWNAAHNGPAPVRQQLLPVVPILEDILLAQLRVAVLFTIFMWIALRARRRDPGLHKRLILLAAAIPLPAALDRIHWLPTTFPNSFLTTDIYTLLAVSPLFLWDLARNHAVHRAYVIFAAFFVPVSAVLYALWDTPIWHATARRIMGV